MCLSPQSVHVKHSTRDYLRLHSNQHQPPASPPQPEVETALIITVPKLCRKHLHPSLQCHPPKLQRPPTPGPYYVGPATCSNGASHSIAKLITELSRKSSLSCSTRKSRAHRVAGRQRNIGRQSIAQSTQRAGLHLVSTRICND